MTACPSFVLQPCTAIFAWRLVDGHDARAALGVRAMAAPGLRRRGPDHRKADPGRQVVHRRVSGPRPRSSPRWWPTSRPGRFDVGRATVSDLLDRWLVRITPTRSPKTLVEYRRKIEGRIRPALGDIRLTKLGADNSGCSGSRGCGTAGPPCMNYLNEPSPR